MEEEKVLEYRMYFFVPYNVSEIQKSLQAGHSALEYAHRYGQSDEFKNFMNNKTWIILNGGTTNDERDFDGIALGTLNQIGDQLNENNIEFAFFREPDLNNALTALCFICDERVFNRKDYPDFVDYILDIKMYAEAKATSTAENMIMLKIKTNEELITMFPEYYKEWVRFVGGIKNVFLRELIKDKKLA